MTATPIESFPITTVAERIDRHLGRVYRSADDAQLERVRDRILATFGLDGALTFTPRTALPGESEVLLITYGDSVVEHDRIDGHLRSLASLVDGPLDDLIETVHILPFFVSSSDGGFSIVDYRAIAEGLGDWPDLQALAKSRGLMVDLVCNHGSAQSDWFASFIADEAPFRDWYTTADADADTTSVVRPRTHDLLLPVETAGGTRHAWATFSHDQIDFDFSNPDVLVEFCSILHHYLHEGGATRVRLDAIAYLWKQLGTTCVHLPETHEIVKLFRTLVDAMGNEAEGPGALLITETNVPHDQNVAYFGDGDEAQVIYNFTLAPLIVWSVLAERGDALTGWLGRLEALPAGCTFLNFIASHDGIGLRPIEDLVSPDELQVLLDRASATGGDWSMYSAPGGPRPYELNVSLADLLSGTDGETWHRFVAAHAVMLAVQGVPAFYIHSLFSTPGDIETVARTEHKRDINRVQLERSVIDERISSGWRRDVFAGLGDLIRLRRGQSAFAPEADQIVHVLHPGVVAIERRSSTQRLLAIQNVTGSEITLGVPDWASTHDLVSGTDLGSGTDLVRDRALVLAPWQTAWLA